MMKWNYTNKITKTFTLVTRWFSITYSIIHECDHHGLHTVLKLSMNVTHHTEKGGTTV